MLITAFADLFGKKSIDTIDTNRQLFVVPRFHSDEKSKQAAIPVRIHLVSDEKKWVVLLVDPSFDPSFKFKNTIKLRGPTENDEIKYLSLVYFSVGQRIGRNQAEWMIPKATEYLRISCHEKNYIYISDPPGRTVGVLLIDQNEKAVAIQTGHEGFNQSDDIKEHDWEFNYPPFMAYPLESEVIYTDQQLINVLNQSN